MTSCVRARRNAAHSSRTGFAAVEPALALLDPKLQSVFAQDFARHRDFSVFGVGQIVANLRRRVAFIVEMHKVPTRQQEQVIWYIIEHMPRRCGGAMDATGSGETLAEYTADKFGHDHVHQIKLNRAGTAPGCPS